MNTYDHARGLDAGAIFTDGTNRYLYSDRSDGTRTAYGRQIDERGTIVGEYGRLPDNLRPEAYRGS